VTAPENRRAAVLGRPVGHSLSPVLHSAGYAAAGLSGWAYTAVDCGEEELAGFVAGLGPEWAGLSLTMPLKEVALAVADDVDPAAAKLGAANTLVPSQGRWTAHNTDAPGMADCLRALGVSTAARMAVLGGGGTARAALGAAREVGAEVTVFVRRAEAGDELQPVAHALGIGFTVERWGRVADAAGFDIVVSTVPKGGADALGTAAWTPPTVIFDVVYDPWPTALADAATRAGCQVVSGLDLLLAQGVRQFELFTGGPAPVDAMRAALTAAAGARAGS
jgi:shikimate dehydrogenase